MTKLCATLLAVTISWFGSWRHAPGEDERVGVRVGVVEELEQARDVGVHWRECKNDARCNFSRSFSCVNHDVHATRRRTSRVAGGQRMRKTFDKISDHWEFSVSTRIPHAVTLKNLKVSFLPNYMKHNMYMSTSSCVIMCFSRNNSFSNPRLESDPRSSVRSAGTFRRTYSDSQFGHSQPRHAILRDFDHSVQRVERNCDDIEPVNEFCNSNSCKDFGYNKVVAWNTQPAQTPAPQPEERPVPSRVTRYSHCNQHFLSPIQRNR